MAKQKPTFRSRRCPSSSSCATRGVKMTLQKILGTWSIWGMSTKEMKLTKHLTTVGDPLQRSQVGCFLAIRVQRTLDDMGNSEDSVTNKHIPSLPQHKGRRKRKGKKEKRKKGKRKKGKRKKEKRGEKKGKNGKKGKNEKRRKRNKKEKMEKKKRKKREKGEKNGEG